MICKKKKLSLVTGTAGNFRLPGDCFRSTSAELRYYVNSLPLGGKIPSAPVTGDFKILIRLFKYVKLISKTYTYLLYLLILSSEKYLQTQQIHH